MASAVGIADPIETAETLVSIARAVIDAGIRLHEPDRDYEFAVLSMGRTGGSEIGFGSDIDVLYVVRGPEGSVERATALVRKLAETVRDRQIKFELDPGLRPEGRKGPLVRSLKSYASYYERWSEKCGRRRHSSEQHPSPETPRCQTTSSASSTPSATPAASPLATPVR